MILNNQFIHTYELILFWKYKAAYLVVLQIR